MKNVQKLIQTVSQKLRPAYSVAEAQAIAWWLVESASNKNKVQLLTQISPLEPAVESKVMEWLQEHLEAHKPIAYILGHIPFLELDILIKPPILIPRPETESWVSQLITNLQDLPTNNLKILDLCTGSGCIALALANALPQSHVTGIDINPQAIALASKNAKHNNIANVTFFESDLYQAIEATHKFDLITANPPYIASDEWDELEPCVTEWEDRLALHSKDKGLHLIKKIIQQAPALLAPTRLPSIPQLTLEIGYKRAKAVTQLLQSHGATHTQTQKDLHGNDRVVMAWW